MQQLPKEVNVSGKVEHRNLFLKIFATFITLIIIGYIFAVMFVFFLPLEKERKLFHWFYEEESMEEVVEEEQTALVRKIVQNIDPSFVERTFVICEDERNAYSFLGGGIFITSDILKALKTENELYFILSHEISHGKEQHSLQRAGFIAPFILISAFIGDVGGIEFISDFITKSHSRGQEKKSDNYAIEKTLKYYGHLGGVDHIFDEEVIGSEAHGLDSYFEQHPSDASRMKKIKQHPEKDPIPLGDIYQESECSYN